MNYTLTVIGRASDYSFARGDIFALHGPKKYNVILTSQHEKILLSFYVIVYAYHEYVMHVKLLNKKICNMFFAGNELCV